MKNKYIFIRHAEVKRNKEVLASQWNLSEEGNKNAENLAKEKELLNADVLISSSENKAFQTILPLAKKLGKEIIRVEEFIEQKRGNKYLSDEDFAKLKETKLTDLNSNPDGGESANQALERFEKGISLLDKKYNNKVIVIASHGTVLSIYFAKILNKYDELFERWKKLGFCNFGIVLNNEVIKDII